MGSPVTSALKRFEQEAKALKACIDAGRTSTPVAYRQFREALAALEIAGQATTDPVRLRQVDAARQRAMRLVKAHVAIDRMEQLALEQDRTTKAWGESIHTLVEDDG